MKNGCHIVGILFIFLDDISLKYLSHAFELSPEVIGDVKKNNGLQTKNSRELKKERGGK